MWQLMITTIGAILLLAALKRADQSSRWGNTYSLVPMRPVRRKPFDR